MSANSARLSPALLGSIAVAGLLGCADAAPPPPLAPLVELAPLTVTDLEESIEATGELIAVESARVAAEVDGRVTELLFDEGDAVQEGDVVVRIDPERHELELADAQAQLAEAVSAVGEAKRESRRVRQLQQRGAASNAQLDAAQTALASARSRVNAAEARVGVAQRELRDAEVKAPFSGLIARRHVSRGEYVMSGGALFDAVAMDPVEVEFHLAERDSTRATLGSPVGVRVASRPDEIFRAEVSMISPTIDPRTRTLRVKARLPNAEHRLRPGLFARVDLGVATRRDVVLIPEQAVMQRASGPIVFVMDGENRVQQRSVETGAHRNGMMEVRSGLIATDRVVASGNGRLIDGSAVRVGAPTPPRRTDPLTERSVATGPGGAGENAPRP